MGGSRYSKNMQKPAEPSKPMYFAETEKAVMLSLNYSMEIAPSKGFTSSMVRDKSGYQKVWIPKSQLDEKGLPSEWITKQKLKDISQNEMSHVVSIQDQYYQDKEGKKYDAARRQAKGATEKYEQAVSAGLAKYDRLVTAAKAAGLKIRNRMKTSTILEIAKKEGIKLTY